MNKARLALAALIIGLIAAFFVFDLGQYFTLDYFKSHQAALDAYYRAHPWSTVLMFFVLYVIVTGLSLPGAVVMTLAAGVLFGLWWGTLIVSFASTIGATLAFLSSRFLLRDAVQRRFGTSLAAINRGMEKEGALYLFTLRLVPLFPFFVINLVMGLTPIRTPVFYLVSQVGMLAGTLVYVNAGTQLGRIESLRDILSLELLSAFVLLGIFPLVTKKAVDIFKQRRALRGFQRPRRFERDLVVIGGGSAGLVSAYLGATLKAKVTLIEKHKMGGECLNTGCVPSKALIRSARFLAQIRTARALGFRSATADFDFAQIMERVRRVIKTVAPHDSVERYTKLGVECVAGVARIETPFIVAVNGRRITTRNIVIATGSVPRVPPIPGLTEQGCLTSDNIWSLRALPGRLLVLGGGPIGCELAQCFARFGSKVTIVQRAERLLPREDPEFSEMVRARFSEEGIDVRLGHRAKEVRRDNDQHLLVCEYEGKEVRLAYDAILVALGRSAQVKGLGLEELGIQTSDHGTIAVDDYLRTRFPNIFACGDVAGPFQFTHTAAHQAWFVVVNALFGSFKKFKVDYTVIPWCTFTDPEVARVGINETEARTKKIPYEVTTFDLAELDRAIADEAAVGSVKVLTVPGKDKILGATIGGEHAGELIAEFVTAMRHGMGLNKMLRTIHVYPTWSEANKYVAGAWKRAHAPQGLLRWIERYHGWRRG